jgi:capsid portal protein
MTGFDPKETLRTIVRVCRDLSTALDTVLNIQDELLGIDFGADKWGDWEWERIASALGWAASTEERLNHAAEDLAKLKQQLEELKEEYNRRTLAKRG